jgi:hypothetical protein
VEIFQQPIGCLVDSGAECCFADSSLLPIMWWNEVEILPPVISGRYANGVVEKELGSCIVNIQTEYGILKEVHLHFVSKLSSPIILGWDVISQQRDKEDILSFLFTNVKKNAVQKVSEVSKNKLKGEKMLSVISNDRYSSDRLKNTIKKLGVQPFWGLLVPIDGNAEEKNECQNVNKNEPNVNISHFHAPQSTDITAANDSQSLGPQINNGVILTEVQDGTEVKPAEQSHPEPEPQLQTIYIPEEEEHLKSIHRKYDALFSEKHDLTISNTVEDILIAVKKREVKDCEVVKEVTTKGSQSDSVEKKEVFVRVVRRKMRAISYNTVTDCQPINLEPFIFWTLQRTSKRNSENRMKKNKLNISCYRKH